MGLTESKSLTYRDSIEIIRNSLVDDSLNKDFFTCIYNLPVDPIGVDDNLMGYNIINSDNIGLLALISNWIKKHYNEINIMWGDMESGTIPINNIDDLENEIDSIYFMSDVKNVVSQLDMYIYIIGKLKGGQYFTIYINFGKTNDIDSKFIFYNNLKSIQSESIFEKMDYKYNHPFLTYIKTL